jgi:hypothetical protein
MRHRILMGASVACILLVFVVMPVAAQASLPSGQEILARLAPRRGTDLLLDLLLYTIFGIGFLTMILVPDKQLFPSVLMLGVIMAALIAKLQYVSINVCDLATFGINVFMFAIPMLVAGMVRARAGKTPKALWPAVLTGLLGGLYFFAFWAIYQQRCEFLCPECLSNPQTGGRPSF